MINKNQIFFITSAVGGGKTSFAQALSKEFIKHQWRVGGFITINTKRTEKRTKYSLQSITNGVEMEMIDTHFHNNWLPFRRFYFNPETLKFGVELIENRQTDKTDLLIIDEVGPMELELKGWHESLLYLIKTYKKPMLWIVRNTLLEQIQEFYNFTASDIYDVKDKDNLKKCIVAVETFLLP